MRRSAMMVGATVVSFASAAASATGLTIELKDAAPDRVERQRAAALGSLPLPGTPDLANRAARLAEKGLKAGDPVFIRIFKSESELELWMRKDNGAYVLFETYPICHWSGTLGPKLLEGDKQNPEGFYTVTRSQLHLIGRWPRSLNLGFPNDFDKSQGRTGSYILIHGGCTSVGCFAMTNAVVAEIFDLAEQALKRGGQSHVHVHAFPFRMTDAHLAAHRSSPWYDFWANLKEGYDAFEQTHVPPRVGICSKRYAIEQSGPAEAAAPGPLAVCGATVAANREMARSRTSASPSRLSERQIYATTRTSRQGALPLPLSSQSLSPSGLTPNLLPLVADRSSVTLSGRSALGGPLPTTGTTTRISRDAAAQPECRPELASCRHWIAQRAKAATEGKAAPGATSGKHRKSNVH